MPHDRLTNGFPDGGFFQPYDPVASDRLGEYVEFDSPLERRAVDLIDRCSPQGFSPRWFLQNTLDEVDAALARYRSAFSRFRVCAFAQVAIGRFRVDFLLYVTSGFIQPESPFGRFHGVVIECDGEAFHGLGSGNERADMERHRYLQALGLDVRMRPITTVEAEGGRLLRCSESATRVSTVVVWGWLLVNLSEDHCCPTSI